MMYLPLRFLLVGLILLNINVNGQNILHTDLLDYLKLVKAIDLSNEELYQAKLTERNELFVVLRNRVTKEWAFYKGAARHVFSPCSNNKYTGGTLNREGNRLSISCEDFSVEIWNLETGNILKRLNVRKAGKSQDYLIPYVSPDGKKLVAEIGERAELWEIESSRKIADFTSERTNCYCNRSIYSVEFSPDSKIVAVAFGGMVFLWNAENGELLNRLIDKKPDFWGYEESDQITGVGSVRSLLFSKDSKTIITGSSIGIAALWDVETGELLRKFKKHKLAVTAIAVSPDDKVLATGSRNQDVKLWDIATGKLIVSLNNRKEVRRISFRPDGARLMSMTSTHVFIWDTKTGSLLHEMPIPDILYTSLSPNWKYFIMPDKKKRSLMLYEYDGS